jgi:hypothetical protein
LQCVQLRELQECFPEDEQVAEVRGEIGKSRMVAHARLALIYHSCTFCNSLLSYILSNSQKYMVSQRVGSTPVEAFLLVVVDMEQPDRPVDFQPSWQQMSNSAL